MLVQDSLSEEIKPLTYCYIFHFIFYTLLFILHYTLYYKIYWLNGILTKIFIFITYFGIIFYIIPAFQMMLLCIKYFKLKIFRIFKKISLIFFILSITIGLMTFIIFLFNTIKSKKFCKECPLSYTLDNLNYTFSNLNKENSEEDNCHLKRCILFSQNINEKYAYSYLCNYEIKEENEIKEKNEFKRKLPNGTEIISNNEFICYELWPTYTQISFNSNIYYNYLDLCSYYTKFYICERFSEPENYYIMQNDEQCPEDNYMIFLYILSVLIIITDIIISLLPWLIEYLSFKRILEIAYSNNRSISNISTKKSTVNSNNAESFKKEETIIIVSPLNIKNNEKEEDKNSNTSSDKRSDKNNKISAKDSDDFFELKEIKIHNNLDKINLKEEIKSKKLENINNIKSSTIEESDRTYLSNKNKDIKDNKDIKNNNYLNDKEDNNNNIINITKNKNIKK